MGCGWISASVPVRPDPFEDETKYPGVKLGARGKNLPVGSYYGYGTGVLGLRLFPNPAFDDAAAKKWDPVRYYTDPSYYKSPDLVRPYRVGMSCGFCHVSANPINPPPDPENPKWEHISSLAGAQYLWMDRVFSWEAKQDNFIYQLFQTWRPGTTDVSFVSQDNIDNPRTMNAVYNVGARMELAKKFGKETLAPENRDSLQLNHYVPASSPLASFFEAPDTVYTMRVLKDGSDSVGVIAALNRVYINIGLFSEEWRFTSGPAGRRARHAHSGEGRPPELCILAGHGSADVRYGGVSVEGRKTPPAERCRRKVGSRRVRCHPRPRQDRLCQSLPALPLEQASYAAGGSQPGSLFFELSGLLE